MPRARPVAVAAAVAATALSPVTAQERINSPGATVSAPWAGQVELGAAASFTVFAETIEEADAQKLELLRSVASLAHTHGKWGVRTAPEWRVIGPGESVDGDIEEAAYLKGLLRGFDDAHKMKAYVLEYAYLDAPVAEGDENVYSLAEILSDEQAALPHGEN